MMQIFTFRTGLRWVASVVLLCYATALSAQMLDTRGIVTDIDGEPLVAFQRDRLFLGHGGWDCRGPVPALPDGRFPGYFYQPFRVMQVNGK